MEQSFSKSKSKTCLENHWCAKKKWQEVVVEPEKMLRSRSTSFLQKSETLGLTRDNKSITRLRIEKSHSNLQYCSHVPVDGTQVWAVHSCSRRLSHWSIFSVMFRGHDAVELLRSFSFSSPQPWPLRDNMWSQRFGTLAEKKCLEETWKKMTFVCFRLRLHPACGSSSSSSSTGRLAGGKSCEAIDGSWKKAQPKNATTYKRMTWLKDIQRLSRTMYREF